METHLSDEDIKDRVLNSNDQQTRVKTTFKEWYISVLCFSKLNRIKHKKWNKNVDFFNGA